MIGGFLFCVALGAFACPLEAPLHQIRHLDLSCVTASWFHSAIACKVPRPCDLQTADRFEQSLQIPTLSNTTRFLQKCRPGPKSGRTFMHRLQEQSKQMSQVNLPDDVPHQQYGGEGYLPWSWREMTTGFDASHLQQLCPVKIQDKVPQMGSGPKCCPLTTVGMKSVAKRSYRRACKRAAEDGYAWYRGQHVPFDAFPQQMRDSLQRLQVQQPPRARHFWTEHTRVSPQHRINIMHVNVGGLANTKLAEIQHWALQKDIDAIVLTESRWTFTSEWSNPKWNCIHSGTSQDHSDGILILVRPHVCPVDKIGITEYIPGRLIHIRFHFKARSFDLICCYQYVDNRQIKQRKIDITFGPLSPNVSPLYQIGILY